MSDGIKRVSQCSVCDRLTTETVSGGLVSHPSRGPKCAGKEPKKNGTTKYRFTTEGGLDPQTGKRKQITETHDKLNDAKHALNEIRTAHGNSVLVPPHKMTLNQWLDEWMEQRKAELEVSSYNTYRHLLKPVREYLGHMRMQLVTEDHVRSLRDWLLVGARRRGGKVGTGLRPVTVREILGRLKTALEAAHIRKFVRANVAQFVKVPSKAFREDARNNKRATPWGILEVQEFLVGIKGDPLFLAHLLSLMGLRASEVCGQRWTDIDWEKGTTTVANARVLTDGEVVEKYTKSESGERTLPYPDIVGKGYRALRVMQDAELAALGMTRSDRPGSDYIFMNVYGDVMTTQELRGAAYAHMARLGLRRVQLRDARRACLTYLSMNGVPRKILAAWAGHTNADFTERVYVSADIDSLRLATGHLETLFGFSEAA
ncbi:tyrosine-type recombinase/integrase [Streptomyces sp. NPDC057307]|uniref:tyrosine-type recombinase/integrase n=1 Tax=Streptomyces sp. NPDC057307 TaxID=3346096 RepID=UPI0036406B13